jgi:hypothetical protein
MASRKRWTGQYRETKAGDSTNLKHDRDRSRDQGHQINESKSEKGKMDEYKEKVVRERSEGDHESWRDNRFGFGLPYIWPELGPVSVLGAWQLCTPNDGSVWIVSSAYFVSVF